MNAIVTSKKKIIIELVLAINYIKTRGNIFAKERNRSETKKTYATAHSAEDELTCVGVRHRVFGEEQKVAEDDEVGDNKTKPRVLKIVPQVLVHVIGVLTLCVQGLSPH